MSNKIIIAIDAMGGDDSPYKIIKAENSDAWIQAKDKKYSQ